MTQDRTLWYTRGEKCPARSQSFEISNVLNINQNPSQSRGTTQPGSSEIGALHLLVIGLHSPRAAARVGAPPPLLVFNQTNLPAIDVCSIQFLHSSPHVRVGAELNHALIGTLLMGICIGHLTCLSHEILQRQPKLHLNTAGNGKALPSIIK